MASKKKAAVVEEPAPVPEVPVYITGKGIFAFSDTIKYDGEWIEDVKIGKKLRHGLGTYINGPEKYEGAWDFDFMQGQGKYTFSSGAKYQGAFEKNLFAGEGVYTFPDGATYTGSWKENKMHGKGTYVDKNKAVFAGDFFNGCYDSGEAFVALR